MDVSGTPALRGGSMKIIKDQEFEVILNSANLWKTAAVEIHISK